MAGLHTLGLLCWPDEKDQEQRVIAAQKWLRRCYETRMVEVAERALLYLLDDGAAHNLNDAFQAINVPVNPDTFFAPFVLNSRRKDDQHSGEDEFWYYFLGASPSNHQLEMEPRWLREQRLKLSSSAGVSPENAAERQWWLDRVARSRDLANDLPEYAFANAMESAILEPPMLAGLGLVLAAAAKAPAGRVGSLNAAWKTINRNELLGQTWDVTSLFSMWSQWCPIAPLWAGVLAETRCWQTGTWRDFADLEAAIIQTISLRDRRNRAYSYAKWFVTDVAPKKAVGAKAPLIASGIIIGLPDTIVALKPDLSGATRD